MSERDLAGNTDAHLLRTAGADGVEREQFPGDLPDLVGRVIRRQPLAPGVDAEDVRQDTLLAILERTAGEEPRGETINNIFGYAVRSAINACRKTFRRPAQQVSLNDDDDPTATIQTAVRAEQEVRVINKEMLRVIWARAESELSRQQLAVLLLDKRDVFERLSPGIVSRRRLAEALDISGGRLIELRKRLPLEDKELAAYLGISSSRVHFLRYQVNGWLRRLKL
jgi:DNA-directed RNA polymerase specialized sigma24 family protein